VFLGSMSASSNVTLSIKKINFLGSYQTYQVMLNNAVQSLSVSSNANGFLTISNVVTSTASTQYAYFVTAVASSSAGNAYSSQRI
jgi:hypothetical protein